MSWLCVDMTRVRAVSQKHLDSEEAECIGHAVSGKETGNRWRILTTEKCRPEGKEAIMCAEVVLLASDQATLQCVVGFTVFFVCLFSVFLANLTKATNEQLQLQNKEEATFNPPIMFKFDSHLLCLGSI